MAVLSSIADVSLRPPRLLPPLLSVKVSGPRQRPFSRSGRGLEAFTDAYAPGMSGCSASSAPRLTAALSAISTCPEPMAFW